MKWREGRGYNAQGDRFVRRDRPTSKVSVARLIGNHPQRLAAACGRVASHGRDSLFPPQCDRSIPGIVRYSGDNARAVGRIDFNGAAAYKIAEPGALYADPLPEKRPRPGGRSCFPEGGVIAYLVLCLASLAAGNGLLKIFRLSLPHASGLFLAPVAACAFWSVALGWGVLSGVGVRTLAFVLYPASLALAAYGARDLLRESRRSDQILVVCALAAPALTMAPYFLKGLTSFAGSAFPDRWYYLAFGKFLWGWPESLAAAGRSPLFDYAANQGLYRFISGALMALFSPLVGSPGDPLAASGPFLAWGLFSFGCACLFFARASGLFTDVSRLAACLFLSLVSGWTLNAVATNNYDNILVLAFFSALAGLFAAASFKDRRQALFIGFLAAAPAYFYPESLAPLAAVCACLFAWRFIEDRDAGTRAKLIFAVCIPATMILLSLPQISLIQTRLTAQLGLGLAQNAIRPGEGYFPGLLSVKDFPAVYFGLSLPMERLSGLPAMETNVLALVLFGLFATGLFALARRRMWGTLGALGVFLAGQCLMILVYRYDYGAYKFLLMGWWLTAACLVAGTDALAALVRRASFAPRALRAAAAIPLALFLIMIVGQSLRFGQGVFPANVEDYAVIAKAREAANGEPMGVFFKKTGDIPWAAYYLGGTPAALFGRPHEYFSAKTLSRTLSPEARRAAKDVFLVLTDSADFQDLRPNARLVWSGGRFRLYRTGAPLAFLTDFSSPGGADMVENRVVFYLGRAPAAFSVFSSGPTQARFRALAFRGPALAGQDVRLRLAGKNGFEQTLDLNHDGEILFVLPLTAGDNPFSLQALGDPSMNVAPNGAGGPALLGLTGMGVLAGP